MLAAPVGVPRLACQQLPAVCGRALCPISSFSLRLVSLSVTLSRFVSSLFHCHCPCLSLSLSLAHSGSEVRGILAVSVLARTLRLDGTVIQTRSSISYICLVRPPLPTPTPRARLAQACGGAVADATLKTPMCAARDAAHAAVRVADVVAGVAVVVGRRRCALRARLGRGGDEGGRGVRALLRPLLVLCAAQPLVRRPGDAAVSAEVCPALRLRAAHPGRPVRRRLEELRCHDTTTDVNHNNSRRPDPQSIDTEPTMAPRSVLATPPAPNNAAQGVQLPHE